MGAPLNNRPSLAQFVGMAPAEIAALSPEGLALLQEEAIAAQEAAKLSRDRVEAAIALRYGEAAANARRAQGKHTGTVRIEDGAVTIVADLPKRITWDQERLAAMVARIKAAKADPAEYVETAYSVSERRYAAWPESIREDFSAARTIATGKPTFRLAINPETRA